MIVPSATARGPTALDVANVADRGNGRKAVGMLMHPRKATRKGVLLGGASSGGSSGGDSREHGGGIDVVMASLTAVPDSQHRDKTSGRPMPLGMCVE